MVFKRSKKPIKARQKSDGFFKAHWKQAGASLKEMWHRPLSNILTLAVIAMALTMPTCLYLVGKNIIGLTSNVVGPSQVTAFIKVGVPDARVLVLKDNIESWQQVSRVEYITPAQGLLDLSAHSGLEQALSLLDEQTLPGVLVIIPVDANIETDEALLSRLSANKDISDIRRDEDWLGRFDAIKNLASTLVISLSVLMLMSVFLVVGNTLRFNVLANKEMIQTMKLIGATDAYILRPYLYTGMWFGVLGAVIAWLLTGIIALVVNHAVVDLAQLYDSDFQILNLSWDETVLVLMVGLFLGTGAARTSAKRHLKEIEPV